MGPFGGELSESSFFLGVGRHHGSEWCEVSSKMEVRAAEASV